MAGLEAAAALVLGAVFAWAGTAKLARRQATAASFAALRVPAPRSMAVVVPLAELALAAALLAAPALGAWGAVVLLLAFTAVLARAVVRGVDAPCACFGSARPEPVSTTEIVRNGGLIALAVIATGASAITDIDLPGLVVVTVAAAMGRVLVAALALRRSTGRLWASVQDRVA